CSTPLVHTSEVQDGSRRLDQNPAGSWSGTSQDLQVSELLHPTVNTLRRIGSVAPLVCWDQSEETKAEPDERLECGQGEQPLILVRIRFPAGVPDMLAGYCGLELRPEGSGCFELFVSRRQVEQRPGVRRPAVRMKEKCCTSPTSPTTPASPACVWTGKPTVNRRNVRWWRRTAPWW
ncbi:unnamed protein product, partial [Tetraodon nigroviridis]